MNKKREERNRNNSVSVTERRLEAQVACGPWDNTTKPGICTPGVQGRGRRREEESQRKDGRNDSQASSQLM